MCDPNIGTCFQAYDSNPSGWVRSIGSIVPNGNPGYRIWANGTEHAATGTNNPFPWAASYPWTSPRKDTIIGWNGYRGTIAEIVVFNTTLTDASRTAVDNYLAGRWGI